MKHSTDFLGEKSFRAYEDGFRACAKRLTDEGLDLTRYGLAQQVDDMEAARKALGYDRIDLLSESAGTRTALIYAWRHPQRIHRSVMIGVNPPGRFLWDRHTTDEQLGRYAGLCAKDESCRTRTDDLAASMRRTAANMPDRWLFLPIQASTVRIFTFYGLMESTSEMAPMNGPTAIDSWLSVAEGDASGLWLQSLVAKLAPMSFVWGQYASAARPDARAAKAYFASGTQNGGSALGYAATAFAWGGGRLADAWPAAPDENAYSRMRTSQVETLLIGGTLDFSTPPQNARKELLPYLPNGHQVVLPGFGHSGSFWSDQPEAGTPSRRHVPRERPGRRLALRATAGRLHAGRDAAGAREGHRGRDGRPGAPDRAVAARDGAAGAPRRQLRTEGERDAPHALPGRARPGRMAPGRAGRHHDDAERPARRRAAGAPVGRHPGRARGLLGLGAARPPRPRRRPPASSRRWRAASQAPCSASMRQRGSWRSSRRSSGPRPARTCC